MQAAIPASSARRRRVYAAARRAIAPAARGATRVSAVADDRYCGRHVARVVPPVRVAGAARNGMCAGAMVTIRGPRPPASRTISRIHSSSPSPEASTSFAPAVAATSAGRGSYSCGSVFGCRMPCTSTAAAADLPGHVGQLGRRDHHRGPAGARAAAGRERQRQQEQAERAHGPDVTETQSYLRARAETANTTPPSVAIVAPGGALTRTRATRRRRPRPRPAPSWRVATPPGAGSTAGP